MEKSATDRYLCQAVMRACDVLEAFQDTGNQLRLKEVAAKTGLSAATAFRILYTLEQRGLVARVGQKRYRLNFRPPRRRRYRIGFANQGEGFSFTRQVGEGIIAAAQEAEVDLLVLDNHYSAKAALKNAERFVREKVDLAIEFQTDEQVAPVISSKLLGADIPIIAVEIPHPGATFFGADNYKAGYIGGRYLARWAKHNWQKPPDEVILLALPIAGPLPRSRLVGTIDGIREIFPQLDDSQITWLDGNGQFSRSLEVVRKYLPHTRARYILVGGINDPSVLGALRAFEEAGRANTCAVIGQNATPEGRAELRRPHSRLVGTVAYFPERYGASLIRLAIDILEHKPVPPAVFVRHRLLTKENVDRVYPNDALLSPTEIDITLLKGH